MDLLSDCVPYAVHALSGAPFDKVRVTAVERFGLTEADGMSTWNGVLLLRAYGFTDARIGWTWLGKDRPTLRRLLDGAKRQKAWLVAVTPDHWIAIVGGEPKDRFPTHGNTRVQSVVVLAPERFE